MTEAWWDHFRTYGMRRRHGYVKGHPYPKSQPADGMRRDAFPPDGSQPGSNLAFMQEQHLDRYGITYGVLNPLGPSGQGEQNRHLSAALASATNDWQLDYWTRHDARLKGSIVVPYEDPQASADEIRKRAGTRDFCQVLLLSRTAEALGRPHYWPIYEAAVEHGLPVGIHVFGYSGWPSTNTGWASFYIEEMSEHGTACSALITSMIMEGLFDAMPELKIVMIEAGFAWLPALGWRLDRVWSRLKGEVPHVRQEPSHYLRNNIWVTTQPMEEPETRAQLQDIIGWIGEDRIMFASDYPHWDFDDPYRVFPQVFAPELRRKVLSANALDLYGLDPAAALQPAL
jgi:predicted TIM-barrel fold metal-dependent hydrolase